jgi:TonB family protein
MIHERTQLLFGLGLALSFCLPVIAQNKSVGDGNSSVTVRHFVAPDYPVAAWLARIQGTVVTQVSIKSDGTVDSVTFVSAHPIFRRSVEAAIDQWAFEVSTATDLMITTEFKLDADCPLTGSQESDKRYYAQTRVSADLPSKVEVKTCLPIVTTETNQTQHH